MVEITEGEPQREEGFISSQHPWSGFWTFSIYKRIAKEFVINCTKISDNIVAVIFLYSAVIQNLSSTTYAVYLTKQTSG